MSKCKYCGYEFKKGDNSIFCPSCLNVREENTEYNPFFDGGDFLAEQIIEEKHIDAEIRRQEQIEQADPTGFDQSIYAAPPNARRPAGSQKKKKTHKAGIIDIIVFIFIVLLVTGTLGKIINGVGDSLSGFFDKIQQQEVTDLGVYTVDRKFENRTVYFDDNTEWFSFEIGNLTIEDIAESPEEWDDLFSDDKDKYLNVNIDSYDEWYLIKVDLNTNGVVGQDESDSDSYCKKAWLSQDSKEICKSLDSADEIYYFVCPNYPENNMYTLNFDIYNNEKNQKVKIEYNFGL